MLTSEFFPVNIALFAVGLYLLIKGCNWFIEAAAFVARRYQVSEMVIGLTLVSIGTSIPELATNVYAAFAGESGIALGNVVGSNITNISLVLGTGIVLTGGIKVSSEILKRDAFFMLSSFVLLLLSALWGPARDIIGRFDGLIFLVVCTIYIWLLFKRNTDPVKQSGNREEQPQDQEFKSMVSAWFFLIIGLTVITLGAKLMVDNVVWIAMKFKIPGNLIAATIIAFGTSVPELAVTVTGVLKKKNAIALGNVIGSCFFNIVLVIGITCLIRPIPVNLDMYVMMVIMISTGVLLSIFMWTSRKLKQIEGAVLLLLYLAFLGYNIYEMT